MMRPPLVIRDEKGQMRRHNTRPGLEVEKVELVEAPVPVQLEPGVSVLMRGEAFEIEPDRLTVHVFEFEDALTALKIEPLEIDQRRKIATIRRISKHPVSVSSAP